MSDKEAFSDLTMFLMTPHVFFLTFVLLLLSLTHPLFLQGVTYTSYPPMSVMAFPGSSVTFTDSGFSSFFESGEFKYSGSVEDRELVEVQAVDPTLLNTFPREEEGREEEEWQG